MGWLVHPNCRWLIVRCHLSPVTCHLLSLVTCCYLSLVVTCHLWLSCVTCHLSLGVVLCYLSHVTSVVRCNLSLVTCHWCCQSLPVTCHLCCQVSHVTCDCHLSPVTGKLCLSLFRCHLSPRAVGQLIPHWSDLYLKVSLITFHACSLELKSLAISYHSLV